MSDFSLVGGGIALSSYGFLSGSTNGTAVTAGSANVKGSWAQLIAATVDDMDGFILDIGSDSIGTTSDFLLEIGIGDSGNEEVVYSNLIYSVSTGLDLDFFHKYNIPIFIPSGTRIAVRIQSTTASLVSRVSISAVPPFFISPVSGQEVISFGDNESDSGGTQVDPGGTANTKGGMTEIVASTSVDVRAIMVLQGQQANATQRVNRMSFDVGIGDSGNEEIISPDNSIRVSQQEVIWGMNAFQPIFIPAGSRLSIDPQSSDNNATDRLLDYVIYGLR